MKITDLPNHLRPREKLMANGPEGLQTYELLAILLRTGRQGKSAIDLAKLILEKYPITQLLNIALTDLTKLKGIDSGKACSVVAAMELSKRATQDFSDTLPIVESPTDAAEQVHELRTLKKEHFVVLFLNARNQLIGKETVSIGTLNASLVHPREVFAPALELRAASIILSHNHPSGGLEKSDDDVLITQRLMQAGELLGIEVLDHILITKNGFRSFRESGWV